jgi:hypothetical protein
MKNMGYSFFRPTVTVFAALTLVGLRKLDQVKKGSNSSS